MSLCWKDTVIKLPGCAKTSSLGCQWVSHCQLVVSRPIKPYKSSHQFFFWSSGAFSSLGTQWEVVFRHHIIAINQPWAAWLMQRQRQRHFARRNNDYLSWDQRVMVFSRGQECGIQHVAQPNTKLSFGPQLSLGSSSSDSPLSEWYTE